MDKVDTNIHTTVLRWWWCAEGRMCSVKDKVVRRWRDKHISLPMSFTEDIQSRRRDTTCQRKGPSANEGHRERERERGLTKEAQVQQQALQVLE